MVLLAAPGEQFKPRHLGHFPVAEDQVDAGAGEQLLGLASVDRLFDADAGEVVAQPLLQQIAYEGRVVHHQHVDLAHRLLLGKRG
ncbi:hypothetical protein D3C84_1217770 [compost metagenome]